MYSYLPCDLHAAATGVALVQEGGARALDLLSQCFSLFRLRIVDAVRTEATMHGIAKRTEAADALAAMADKLQRGEIDME